MRQVALWDAARRRELFQETAAQMGVHSAIVEKDFWVCWVLSHLFGDADLAAKLRFKGGTSLSKAWGLIHRFSEDIDLILDWRLTTGEDPEALRSKSGQEKLNHAMDEQAKAWIASTLLPKLRQSLQPTCEVVLEGETGDAAHVVAVRYPHEGNGLAYVHPAVRLEIGPLAAWMPWQNATIRPYAAETFPQLFAEPACQVPVVATKRTFWEKATILHHEAHRPESIPVPKRYARHYYDLCLMARDPVVRGEALGDRALLAAVAAFKQRFYPRAWARYEAAAQGGLRLVPPEHVMQAMAQDYRDMRDMFFTQPPAWETIISELQQLEQQANSRTIP